MIEEESDFELYFDEMEQAIYFVVLEAPILEHLREGRWDHSKREMTIVGFVVEKLKLEVLDCLASKFEEKIVLSEMLLKVLTNKNESIFLSRHY